MTIIHGKTVAITYTLTLDNGQVVDSNVDDAPLSYVHGEEQLIFGLEQALEGKKAGETLKVSIQPEDGYGVISEDAYIEVPVEHLPSEGRQPGAMITAVGPQGQELEGMVTTIEDATALVDFNHPLAGEVLHFDVTVVSVE
nr:FKBP-type peptidyl-prolyl cis-trans isomerase [uncultured Desulfobulbus sp.]